MSKKSADEIRKEITAKIVTAIKEGTMPWRKPWMCSPNAGLPANFANNRRYTGINTLILMGTSMALGYQSRYWGSSSSILKQIGAHVRKGESCTYVTFFKMLPKRNTNGVVEKTKDGKDAMIPLLRTYPVFNIEQFQAPTPDKLLDGRGMSLVKTMLGDESKVKRVNVTTIAELRTIAMNLLSKKQQPSTALSREETAKWICDHIQMNLDSYKVQDIIVNTDPDYSPAEELIRNSQANIKYGGSRACYFPDEDRIQLPKKTSFENITHFYQTAFHELAHWTKPESRVGRTQKFDSHKDAYAFEELIAEISACFTLIEAGVPLADEMLPKSHAYLANWLLKMENDPKYIFAAATQATKISDYLLSFIGKQNAEFEMEEDNTDKDSHDLSVA